MNEQTSDSVAAVNKDHHTHFPGVETGVEYSGCIVHLAGQPLVQAQVKEIIFTLFLQVIHVGRFPV